MESYTEIGRNNKMLKIAITFDYELFLGKNYIPESEVLFDPTYRIIEMLDEERVHATFFADVCSVFQHNLYKQYEYCDGFSKQIKFMQKHGHDVQLHIHSNWLKSEFNGNQWNIPYSGYKLHDFGFDDSATFSAGKIIKRGKEYLEHTLCEVNPSYKCIAYRAGGFCIRPEAEIIKILLENGIVIDSSVALKQKSVASIQDYDFTDSPNKLNWWFNRKKGILFPVDRFESEMLEVSIGYGRNSIIKFLGIPISDLHVESRHGAGTGIEIPGYNSNGLKSKVNTIKRRLFSDGILSFDTRGYKVLIRDFNYLYRKYRCNKENQYVSIICHPKLASDNTINNMRMLIRELKDEEKYSFVTMKDIANEVGGMKK